MILELSLWESLKDMRIYLKEEEKVLGLKWLVDYLYLFEIRMYGIMYMLIK